MKKNIRFTCSFLKLIHKPTKQTNLPNKQTNKKKPRVDSKYARNMMDKNNLFLVSVTEISFGVISSNLFVNVIIVALVIENGKSQFNFCSRLGGGGV